MRQRGQSKFMMEALGKRFPLMLTKLKKKRDTADDDDMIQFYTESNQNHPSSAEYHHSFKSTGFIKNLIIANLCRQLHRMPSGDPQVDILKKRINKQSHWHHKFCAAGCSFKTSQGCVKCKEFVHLDPNCWNAYYENKAFGEKPMVTNSGKNSIPPTSDRDDSLDVQNVTAV